MPESERTFTILLQLGLSGKLKRMCWPSVLLSDRTIPNFQSLNFKDEVKDLFECLMIKHGFKLEDIILE